jgi:DNA mismatch endonuclease (patch repair protein)
MADIVDAPTRSRMMSRIRGKNTAPELVVRRYLHSRGLRYRIHSSKLPGRPDIVLSRFRTVVFVHGCFWHQHRNCRFAVLPKSNTLFWTKKFTKNRLRDRLVDSQLRKKGWRVLTIWECGMNETRLTNLVRKIRSIPPNRIRVQSNLSSKGAFKSQLQ